MRLRIAFIAAAFCLLAGFAASALGSVFASPSRNIGCVTVGGGEVRCDILRTSATPPPRPASCELDWGQAYGLTQRGRGRGLCVGDTALPGPGQKVRIVKYGHSVKVGPRITCTSRRSGFTCANRNGHGFLLSKQRIRVF